MSRAADVAAQAQAHGVKAAAPFLVTPGSEQVRATIERDGQMQSLRDIGGTVLANACGPCIGQWRRAKEATAAPNTIVTSYNRNFPARNDGQRDDDELHRQPRDRDRARARRPALVQSAHRHAHRRRRQAVPARAAASRRPRCRRGTSSAGARRYVAPPADGSAHRAQRRSRSSERLQLLEPWPAWDGKDFLDMPVLLKTKGKTTTDHISPAGPWLRYRGHLDKFSDNMFIGRDQRVHRRDRQDARTC